MLDPDPAKVADLLGDDPVAGNLALDYFASLGPKCLELFLPSRGKAPGTTGQARRRLARLCRRFGQAAIPIQLQALEKGDWSSQTLAAACFDFYPYQFGDPTAGLVRRIANAGFDAANASLTALGYMGAYGWIYEIIDDIASPRRGDYVFGKLGGVALDSLMLMVPRTKDSEDITKILLTVETHFENLEKHDPSSGPAVSLRWNALTFGPPAADPLVRNWIRHPRTIYRSVALESLSVIGLRRTAGTIAERLLDTSEEGALQSAAARYLGDIGGTVAVETLERLLAQPGLAEPIRTGALWGLSSLYPEATKSLSAAVIDEILASESQMRLHLVHSLGFRREGTDRLRSALQDRDPMVRGAAALSLARTLGSEALPLLRVAVREATDDFEHALALCGLICAGETERTEDLHKVLCRFRPKFAEIWQLQERWKREVVAALAATPDRPFANAWSDVLRVDLTACQEKLAAWGGSYPVSPNKSVSSDRREATGMQQRDLVFISYSHSDERICEEFLKMLRPTAEKHELKIWSDHQIQPGDIWRDEIEKALAHARIAVLLVSPDFLVSRFIKENELPPLLQAAKNQGAHIFWIACRHCNVADTEIGKFQGANQPDRPLAAFGKTLREREIQRITQKLLQLSQVAP